MKLDFFIFRHGETEWNRLRRVQGHSDIPLNETGKSQAKELSLVLSKFQFDHVYSSDLSRAMETVQIALPSYKVNKTQMLREAYLGEAEGLTIDEINIQYGEEFWLSFVAQNTESENRKFPGGETVEDTNRRVLEFINSIINNQEIYAGRETTNIVLSCHGAIIRNILGHLFPLGKGETYDIPNCVIYKISYLTTTKEWVFGGRVI